MNADDARDLAQARQGEQQAFGRLYDRHAAVVLSLCRMRCGSGVSHLSGGAEADDACQETFIRAFTMLSRVNGEASESGFRRWLYAIARRVCAERRRASRRRVRHEAAAMSAATLVCERESAANVSRAGALADAAEREALDRLTAALNELDEHERLAIHLHYLDADPLIAAREALGLSRSAYYKLLARARDRLATLMQKRCQTPFFEERS